MFAKISNIELTSKFYLIIFGNGFLVSVTDGHGWCRPSADLEVHPLPRLLTAAVRSYSDRFSDIEKVDSTGQPNLPGDARGKRPLPFEPYRWGDPPQTSAQGVALRTQFGVCHTPNTPAALRDLHTGIQCAVRLISYFNFFSKKIVNYEIFTTFAPDARAKKARCLF